jgi:hypothetical protein
MNSDDPNEPASESGLCPECGSDDVQVESYLAEDGTALEWGGFYCVSCGYLVRKTAAKSGSPWSLDIHRLCAISELAFCVGMGLEWKPNVNRRRTDVCGYELRARRNHSCELLVRKDDIDGRKAVLVTGSNRTFCIRGWFSIGEAKTHPEWLATYGSREEAWFVPQSALLNFS